MRVALKSTPLWFGPTVIVWETGIKVYSGSEGATV